MFSCWVLWMFCWILAAKFSISSRMILMEISETCLLSSLAIKNRVKLRFLRVRIFNEQDYETLPLFIHINMILICLERPYAVDYSFHFIHRCFLNTNFDKLFLNVDFTFLWHSIELIFALKLFCDDFFYTRKI